MFGVPLEDRPTHAVPADESVTEFVRHVLVIVVLFGVSSERKDEVDRRGNRKGM